jgi:hypothetical protein
MWRAGTSGSSEIQELVVPSGSTVQAVHQEIQVKVGIRNSGVSSSSSSSEANGLNSAGTSGFRNTGVSSSSSSSSWEVQFKRFIREQIVKWCWYIRKFRKYRS